MTPRQIILKCFMSPGDIVMLTAAVRDLHLGNPGQFITDVRTTAQELWDHNPYISPLNDESPDVVTLDMHYPLINQSNRQPYHFIHGYAQFLEEQFGVRIQLTEFKGDIHVSDLEKSWMSQVQELGFEGSFWIVIAGGKYDYTAKWWSPSYFQEVIDHFKGRIQFVQCGEASHWHPRLNGVIDLVGKTDVRQFVRLMYHADGVVCPVTFAMHLAAAVETKPGKPPNRPCVVVAGGREPTHWEAYPHHQFLHTLGTLTCCQDGGCWKSRCQLVGDGDEKDNNLCDYPVQIQEDLRIPKCMHAIKPADVIRRIELYVEGGLLQYSA